MEIGPIDTLVAPGAADAAGPEPTAIEFVQHVQRGVVEKAKRLLESSGYRYRSRTLRTRGGVE